MTAPVDFSGKWKETKKENFDEFSAAVGMPWIARKMAAKAYPEMNIEQTGNHFKISTSMVVFTSVIEFTVGEEFIFEPPKSGNKMKSIPRWEGDKLIVDATPENPETSNVTSQVTTRELNGPDETIVTVVMNCKDRENEVIMKRWFSRVK